MNLSAARSIVPDRMDRRVTPQWTESAFPVKAKAIRAPARRSRDVIAGYRTAEEFWDEAARENQRFGFPSKFDGQFLDELRDAA